MLQSGSARVGNQRLSVERLDSWRALEYGMFIHYGMATFSPAPKWPDIHRPIPVEHYRPSELDVGQWLRTAKAAGMQYAVLTAKHGTGFCLWPSRHTEYHVGNAPVKADVVREFVDACARYGIRPGLYYAGRAVMRVTSDGPEEIGLGVRSGGTYNTDKWPSYCDRTRLDFIMAQLEELLTEYGGLEEIWLDGPHIYGDAGRHEVYDRIAGLQLDVIIALNGAWEDSGKEPQIKPRRTWPSDVICIEAAVPPIWGTSPWRRLEVDRVGNLMDPPLDYYIPAEANTIMHENGRGWFWGSRLTPFTDEHLLGIRLITRARNANLLLNVTPDPRGLIPESEVEALLRLRANVELLKF